MAVLENGFPFDNMEYDATALGAWLSTRTRGVFSDDEHYAVTLAGGMQVNVSAGIAWLKMNDQWGMVAPNPAAITLSVDVGDTILNRIDVACLRIDKNQSVQEVVIKKGELAATPVYPALVRDLNYDEVFLAAISVPAGTTELTAALITDLRANEEYCGIMRDGVTGIPTAQLQLQAQALLEALQENVNEVLQETEESAQETLTLIEEELQRLNAGTEVMLKTEYAPDATAEFLDGVLTINSTYTPPGTDYFVSFIAPMTYDDTIMTVIDGDTMLGVLDLTGEPIASETFAEGVPVLLHRIGDNAYFTSGSATPIIVTVTCDEALEGETVTISQGSKVYDAVVPASLVVEFRLPALGTWVLSNPITGMTLDILTTYYGQYNVNLYTHKVFGIEIDLTNSNPATSCVYTDDAVGMIAGSSNWYNQAIFKNLRNCILEGGEVVGYLKKDNLNQYEDGTTAPITTLGSDVMLEIPERVGYSIEWVNEAKTKLAVKITDHPNHPDFNYDAFSMDAYNDCDKIYIGTYKSHCTGSQMYSCSGKAPTANQTIGTYRTWAKARGSGYFQGGYGQLKLRQCMYLIFYKTLNSQAAVGMGYVGGSAAQATGATNALGFTYGNPASSTTRMKLFGIEDFWGNIWEWVDGVVSDGSRNVLTAQYADLFNDAGTNYTNNGNGGVSASITNYMKLPQGGSGAGFTARDVTGSDSTYFCDYATLYASCVGLFGGAWDNASYAGAFQLYLNNASSTTGAYFASRLMYLHKEN